MKRKENIVDDKTKLIKAYQLVEEVIRTFTFGLTYILFDSRVDRPLIERNWYRIDAWKSNEDLNMKTD